jgi:segregation and condensation protein B
MTDAQHLRMTEALLFAAEEPLDEATLATRLPDGADVPALLAALGERYGAAGVNLVRVAGKWQFRTAPDLHYLLEAHRQQPRKLSRAALETLAIIAYHQPITRAEVEEVRGVGLSRGTLDILLEIGWVRPRGRRRVPGRPVTYGTTDAFLEHFGLEDLKGLPGLDELKAAGLLQGDPPPLQLSTAPEDPDDGLEGDSDDGGRDDGTLPHQGKVIGLDGAEIEDGRSIAD